MFLQHQKMLKIMFRWYCFYFFTRLLLRLYIGTNYIEGLPLKLMVGLNVIIMRIYGHLTSISDI